MDVREKLVELIEKASYECDEGTRDLWDMREVADGISDFLIANGVTVQSKIDAKIFQLMREIERLKEEKESFANAVNVLDEINSDLYKQIKGVTVQEWISVKDRLPEDTCNVLAHCLSGYVGLVMYIKNIGFEDAGIRVFVTHWMPLPEPPKGLSNG